MKQNLLRMTGTFLIILLCSIALTACGGGSSSEGTATTGTVSVSLTDDSDLYNAVVLSIEKIGIVASNTPTTYYNAADFDALPVTVNVLDLPNEKTLFLGDIYVPIPANSEVCFNQIRLVLADEGNYVIEKNDPIQEHRALKTPSGQQSGVKVLTPNEQFCLNEGDNAVSLALDFDPAKAIIAKPNSANPYQLKPTGIRIIEGDFFQAPDSYIDGLVAIPTAVNNDNTCAPLDTDPLVTVTAAESGTETVVVKTVALAEGPWTYAEACEQWCAVDATCPAECPLSDETSCYYTGAFKLLLVDDSLSYDLKATWNNMVALDPSDPNETSVSSGSTVLLELAEQPQ